LAVADEPQSGVEELRHAQGTLRAELVRIRRRLSAQLALESLAELMLTVVGLGAVLVLLDWWFRLDLVSRRLLLVAGIAAVVAPWAMRAWRRWRAARLDELSIATLIDRQRPGVGQSMADILQLPSLLETSSSTSVSPAMVRLAVSRAIEALESSDWRSVWNRNRTLGYLGLLLVGLAVPLGFRLAAPGAARLSWDRWLLGSNERWPQQTYLSIVGLGDENSLIAPRGEPFVIEVGSDLPGLEPIDAAESSEAGWRLPGRGEPFRLRHRPEAPVDPPSVTIRERLADGSTRLGVMTRTGDSTFRYEFPPAEASSRFGLFGGDDWLGPIRLERVDRPRLTDLELRAREPGSEGFRTVETMNQHLMFLPETELVLRLDGEEPLADAWLKTGSEDVPAPVLERLDDRSFEARWNLAKTTTLEIGVASERTGLESKPTFVSIGLERDRVPRVSLRATGVGAHVTPVATIPMTVGATDDLGLASLRIRIERTKPPKEEDEADRGPAPEDEDQDESDTPRTETETIELPLPSNAERAVLDHQVRRDLELVADPPPTGTVLKLVAEAEDRCAQGAQVGQSAPLTLLVVSPEDLFYEILLRQRAERTRFVRLIEKAEAQSPVLDGAPTPDDALEVMRAYHTVGREIEQSAGRLEAALEEMVLNRIGTTKSHRLMREAIIAPMRDLAAGPIANLKEELQLLASGRERTDATSARKRHAAILKELQAILEQMAQWESFVDVVNQVAEVIRLEREVLRATEEARESRTEEIFDDLP